MPRIKPPEPLSPSNEAGNASADPPPFVPCPRMTPSSGNNDWLILTDSRFTNFDVCPTCYEKCIAPTRYASFFQRSPPKPANMTNYCDFSIYWVRLAWRHLWQEQQSDVSLLAKVAGVDVPEGPCPTDATESERTPAVRKWFCVRHPVSGHMLEDFTVCSDCVLHLETMLPTFHGVFVPLAPTDCQATCDLRGNGSRTISYFTHIFDIHAAARKTGRRDITPLANYIELVASVPECRKRDPTATKPYYVINTVFDFAICTACYQETVYVNLHKRNYPCIAEVTEGKSEGNYICDLYSPRMRQLWDEANERGDLAQFRRAAEERRRKFQEAVEKIAPLKRQQDEFTRQLMIYRENARLTQQSEMAASLASVRYGIFGSVPRVVVGDTVTTDVLEVVDNCCSSTAVSQTNKCRKRGSLLSKSTQWRPRSASVGKSSRDTNEPYFRFAMTSLCMSPILLRISLEPSTAFWEVEESESDSDLEESALDETNDIKSNLGM